MFEGELLNISAFDQPGVEGYKNYMYYKLRKPGIPKNIAEEIKKHPCVRRRNILFEGPGRVKGPEEGRK